jgi:transcriptional regulator with GAF, ATPase, and Fis domain
MPPSTYHLIRELGRGATARVWLVEDEDGAPAVLKVAHDVALAPVLAAEAVHACTVASPHLPMLVGFGSLETDGARACLHDASRGLPCVAYRWREGETLVSATLTAAEASAAIRGVAEALEELHEVGLAHGDVKPENVLVRGGSASLLDWGSVTVATSEHPAGGTPRYLGRGDAELGDGRARDLLALGLLIAERVEPTLRSDPAPLARARSLVGDQLLPRIALALLSATPTARPSARWVAERLRLATERVDLDERRTSDLRRVRSSYLRLRRADLGAAGVGANVAPYLRSVIAEVRRARALCVAVDATVPAWFAERADVVASPLGRLGRERWAASLVGPHASTWGRTLHAPSEVELAQAFERLAEWRPSIAWTASDLDRALRGRPLDSRVGRRRRKPSESVDVASLALELARTTTDGNALEEAERNAQVLPAVLIERAVGMLRLRGELGRAEDLVRAHGLVSSTAAEVARRARRPEEARRIAMVVMAREDDDAHRARALLARLDLDDGELDRAESLLGEPSSASEYEVAALLSHRRGRRELALRQAELGRALAGTDEEAARLTGTLAYVLHPASPSTTFPLFAEAAEFAARAGALVEEATYRTGEAAAALDVGRLDVAEAASRRAIVLFDDILRQPTASARAWLTRAALAAALGDTHETEVAAAETLARATRDVRAGRFARLCLADAFEPGAGTARAAALAALHPSESPLDVHLVDALDDDTMRVLARAWHHEAAGDLPLLALDRRATSASAVVALEWWHARATRLLASSTGAQSGPEASNVLAALEALADADAPVITHARAMHAGRLLASAQRNLGLAQRLELARRRSVGALALSRDESHRQRLERQPWAGDHAIEEPSTPRDHRVDLERLVRALGERDDLDALLLRVLDVLLESTGADRAMLLLRRASGKLTPRATRHLSRRQLGSEQLAVSMSLAERALTEGHPIVAVDAMSELAEHHESAVALELRSLLILPLRARGEPLGVVYLDDRVRRGAFGSREVEIALTIAPIAAIAIADARKHASLERARRRAERAVAIAERTLARDAARLATTEDALARVTGQRSTRFSYDEILGNSASTQRLLNRLDRIAPSDMSVLIQGESGSGKELVARALHRNSPRADGPFVSENCAALPDTLLESLLFGHVRGAFTRAHRTQVGLFEAADGGTLFLDEIGEMSLAMQSKLLRVLEDGVVRPVGAEREHRVDVRLVAATHRDLGELVARGLFREDLRYRLDVVRLMVPPLRDRLDDVPLLARHFVERNRGDRNVAITKQALAALARHAWPGNVRELENEMRRALVACDDVLDVEHLTLEQASRTRPPETMHLRTRIDALEVELVSDALARTSGNQTRAAELLGLSRYGLHKLMLRLGLKSR